jgi:hypothetical protein
MSLVECLHFSTQYPTGGQSVGDVFNLTEDQVLYYESLGWVRKLEDNSNKKKRKRVKSDSSFFRKDSAIDLSSMVMFKRKR